jgi:uncharacterized protein (DUF983 family)
MHETGTSSQADRPLGPAVRNGLRCRCPNCGTGRIFDGYLKVRPSCPACGEDLSHQRADDGPAYLTILIVGHIFAPLILLVYTAWRPEPLTLALMFSFGAVTMSLLMLPPMKGMMVAFQWARRIHGFGHGAAA